MVSCHGSAGAARASSSIFQGFLFSMAALRVFSVCASPEVAGVPQPWPRLRGELREACEETGAVPSQCCCTGFPTIHILSAPCWSSRPHLSLLPGICFLLWCFIIIFSKTSPDPRDTIKSFLCSQIKLKKRTMSVQQSPKKTLDLIWPSDSTQ